MEDLVVAGGTEMMSHTATLREATAGLPMLDSGNLRLCAVHPQPHQGVCADAIATLEGIGRADVDALALESQKLIRQKFTDLDIVNVHHAGKNARATGTGQVVDCAMTDGAALLMRA